MHTRKPSHVGLLYVMIHFNMLLSVSIRYYYVRPPLCISHDAPSLMYLPTCTRWLAARFQSLLCQACRYMRRNEWGSAHSTDAKSAQRKPHGSVGRFRHNIMGVQLDSFKAQQVGQRKH